MIEAKVVASGNGLVLEVSGDVDKDFTHTILRLKDHPEVKSLRLDTVTFAIQEKMGVILYWKVAGALVLLQPLESRGYLNWEGIRGKHSPDGLEEIVMESFGVTSRKVFTMMFDFTKKP